MDAGQLLEALRRIYNLSLEDYCRITGLDEFHINYQEQKFLDMRQNLFLALVQLDEERVQLLVDEAMNHNAIATRN